MKDSHGNPEKCKAKGKVGWPLDKGATGCWGIRRLHPTEENLKFPAPILAIRGDSWKLIPLVYWKGILPMTQARLEPLARVVYQETCWEQAFASRSHQESQGMGGMERQQRGFHNDKCSTQKVVPDSMRPSFSIQGIQIEWIWKCCIYTTQQRKLAK